jgi:hypothetical protein
MARHTFRADLWAHDLSGPGSWYFVTVPGPVSEELGEQAGPPRGFGSVRVEVTIGATSWHTSVFPDSARGCYVLPVKRQVRAAEGLEEGSPCEVTLVVIGDGR